MSPFDLKSFMTKIVCSCRLLTLLVKRIRELEMDILFSHRMSL